MKKIKCIPLFTVLILVAMAGITAFAYGDGMPILVSIMLNKAQNQANQGKVETAIKTLSDFQNKGNAVNEHVAAKKGYSHYYIDFAIANYHIMLSQPEKAATCYESAVTKKEDFSQAWLNLAKCRYDLDQMKLAGDAFLKGYETASPKTPLSLYYSGVCYAGAEEYATSYMVFHRLIDNHPQGIVLEWKGSLVHVLLALKKSEEALPYIEGLVENTTGTKQKEWREVLLYQYMALNLDDKAKAYARYLTQVDTLEPKWWKASTHIHLQDNDYQKAVTALLAYGFLTPLSPEETSLMGDIFFALGIPDQAVKYYEMKRPGDLTPKVAKKIVQAYMRLYDYDNALVAINACLQGHDAPELMMLKGNLLFEMEQYGEAVGIFQKLIQSDHEKGKSLLMLGYAAWNVGDMHRAKAAFQEAEKHHKQRKEAQKALKQLEGKS